MYSQSKPSKDLDKRYQTLPKPKVASLNTKEMLDKSTENNQEQTKVE